ncbi:Os04g0497900 [Oryza sativa Japonica Group]|uniref:OSJNBa0067K08.20 protein n=2 Tax=Oryza sativa subsp. japonica TaxID=39947 RepID=Q0JC14_ORYSJ|nr:uncharacterized protein LOC4336289 [Oryza sativa Japonica Group]BAF15123.1 Os04g0497900 [Oryza sativa Japonica Group]BAS89904.1 Os04g0497900 [Oryza sativa Japonica Group]CAD41245.2 OSJNBa0067K08.20 [Oryza sativa Japonica Group]|eukprot:NP_001053209.1 Os04g0497900 [Oryza sativa Japonica Group]
MASASGSATLLYPKTPQSPRLLRRNPHYSGLRLVHPLLLATVSPPPPAALRRRRNSTTIHASSSSAAAGAAAASFPASSTPPPRPPRTDPPEEHPTVARAGRSKKHRKPSGGRIEGGGDVRREAKSRARIRSRRLGENAFYRRKRRAAKENQADAFTDAELEMIGLGYDRSVRFMDGPDDPRLRHRHDWYRFGRYGPYSWRGIVVGPPIRGRFSDDRVSLMSEVSDHDEWDRVEQFDMSNQFSNRLNELDAAVGFRYYWVFVRHPRWRPDELPWEQWTLSAEVAIQASEEQRLDKWNLMGRLGNPTRELITRCAAWTRPDIIYVKRPLYQSRFEPQKNFYSQLRPLVDPVTENQFLFDLEHDGQVIRTTYFGGLCRIVKASPKAYVDDVVNAYSKLSDVDKNRCLEFLLTNHPMELLHPYTKEWKVKLEEMELGCDAPDDNESDDEGGDESGTEVVDWVEDDGFDEGGDTDDDEEPGYDDDEVIDVREEVETEEVESDDESEKYWDEQWKQAMKSSDKMEKLVKTSIEASNEYNRRRMQQEKEMELRMARANTMVMKQEQTEDEDEQQEQIEDEDEQQESPRGRSAKDKRKSKAPGHFLRAAVRPFTYRNLVKEIVLMRHFIVDGEID